MLILHFKAKHVEVICRKNKDTYTIPWAPACVKKTRDIILTHLNTGTGFGALLVPLKIYIIGDTGTTHSISAKEIISAINSDSTSHFLKQSEERINPGNSNLLSTVNY